MAGSHCKHGHELTPDNRYERRTAAGSVYYQCRMCFALQRAAKRRRSGAPEAEESIDLSRSDTPPYCFGCFSSVSITPEGLVKDSTGRYLHNCAKYHNGVLTALAGISE